MSETKKKIRAISASLRAHLEEEMDLGETGLALPAAGNTRAGHRAGAGKGDAGRNAPAEIMTPGPVPGDGASGEKPTRAARTGRGRERAGADRGNDSAFQQPAAKRSAARQPASPETAPVDGPEREKRLRELAQEAAGCTRCALHKSRTCSVFQRGDPNAQLLFVGEGPGLEEDRRGEPFVGKAGQLLDRMIAAMGFERDAVYICNVVKCRPPENRTPRAEEAAACEPFLTSQLELIRPLAIVALGKCAVENLGVMASSGPWRGVWGRWRGIPVMPTYHPAYLLRTPSAKRAVWEDLQAVMQELGKPVGQ